jgi:hypothetical protein
MRRHSPFWDRYEPTLPVRTQDYNSRRFGFYALVQIFRVHVLPSQAELLTFSVSRLPGLSLDTTRHRPTIPVFCTSSFNLQIFLQLSSSPMIQVI